MASKLPSTHATGHRPIQQPRPQPAPASKQLSCVNCRRKKVKCDRGHPCSQCTAYDVRCVVPQRRSPWPARRSNLKAAKPAASDFTLDADDDNDQLSTTELSWPFPHSSGSSFWDSEEAPPEQSPKTRQGSGLGGTFWEAICSEVDGFGYDLDHADSARAPMESPSNPSDALTFRGMDWLLAPPPSPTLRVVMHDSNASPSAIQILSDIFLSNIEPVFKILHRPMLRQVVTEDTTWPQSLSPLGVKSRRALLSAVCFAATTSMSEDDCLELLGEPRSHAVHDWRREAESALRAADPFSTSDFTVLQALTIYAVRLPHHGKKQEL